ncbi:MAG TPA: hypothetical protein VG537_06735 [Candidatus Kapabacteria bacterium]|jgi:photosystem II stability/assembly factor-like uncharacterized protein|nr:hypothetical protein [Candidatus Kapabacteria bacterium]
MKRLLAIGLFATTIVMHSGLTCAQWVQVQETARKPGGTVQCLSANGDKVLAGTDVGLFFSSDTGRYWRQIDRGLPLRPTFEALGFADSILVVSVLYSSASFSKYGVFQSSDNGNTWIQDSFVPDSSSVISLVSTDSFFFAVTSSSVFEMSNNGKDWLPIGVPPFVITGATTWQRDLFVGTELNGIIRSTDLGKSWSLFDDWLPEGHVVISLLADSNYLYALLDTGLYRVADTSTVWKLIYQGGMKSFEISDSNIFIAGAGIRHSSNGGASWYDVSAGFPQVYGPFTFTNSEGKIFIGSYWGLQLYSFDSSKWLSLNSPPLANVVGRIINAGDSLFLTALDGFYLSEDSGLTWMKQSVPFNPAFLRALHIDGDNLLAGTYTDVFRSTNRGHTWDLIDSFPVEVFAAEGQQIYAGGNRGVFFSSDDGISWNHASDGMAGDTNVWALVVNAGIVYAAGQYDGVYRSKDQGRDWTVSNIGFSDTIGVRSLIESGQDIFAGSWGYGVFKSSDEGITWVSVDSGLPSGLSGNSLIIVNGSLIVGTSDDIFISTDLGGEWKQFDKGYTAKTGISNFVQVGNYIVAGTEGSGVWRRPLSDFGISAVAQTPPATPPEIQSYPNPFSQRTTISFTSEAQGYADVRVVNILGAEVARLYSGELSAGAHEFMWSKPSGLPNGMYECVIKMWSKPTGLPEFRTLQLMVQ